MGLDLVTAFEHMCRVIELGSQVAGIASPSGGGVSQQLQGQEGRHCGCRPVGALNGEPIGAQLLRFEPQLQRALCASARGHVLGSAPRLRVAPGKEVGKCVRHEHVFIEVKRAWLIAKSIGNRIPILVAVWKHAETLKIPCRF